MSDFVRGNEKARERMKAQYSIAGMTKGVVVGTDHAAEAITGFFTKYGDGGNRHQPNFPPEQTSGANSCWPISAARNICIRSCPPPTRKTIAPPRRMKWPWCHLREHRRLSGRQNAGPEHRQNDRGLVSENRTQASAADHRL
ncbi:NAD(+) synthase [Klebsiella pneumoniae subsp. pneumoniae]|nr:NAD(+) synthase [Klebsiella pneumoniae subsp. pneumoniae]